MAQQFPLWILGTKKPLFASKMNKKRLFSAKY